MAGYTGGQDQLGELMQRIGPILQQYPQLAQQWGGAPRPSPGSQTKPIYGTPSGGYQGQGGGLPTADPRPTEPVSAPTADPQPTTQIDYSVPGGGLSLPQQGGAIEPVKVPQGGATEPVNALPPSRNAPPPSPYGTEPPESQQTVIPESRQQRTAPPPPPPVYGGPGGGYQGRGGHAPFGAEGPRRFTRPPESGAIPPGGAADSVMNIIGQPPPSNYDAPMGAPPVPGQGYQGQDQLPLPAMPTPAPQPAIPVRDLPDSRDIPSGPTTPQQGGIIPAAQLNQGRGATAGMFGR